MQDLYQKALYKLPKFINAEYMKDVCGLEALQELQFINLNALIVDHVPWWFQTLS